MNRALRIAIVVLCALVFLPPAFGQIGITVSFGPPALPVYELPPCPGDGYLWTPGYWAWDPDYGYYWIPGTWVMAPEPGYLWTPGWWGWGGNGFIFHEGYWATRIGFYGGINYGFGYFGTGFAGGRWDGGIFRYNTAVLNVNKTIIHNTYIDRTVIVNNNVNHVSYNGGEGGVAARPTSEQERVAQERHLAPVAAQQQHIQTARMNPAMRASQNQGRPAVAATARPGEFSGHDVVAARAAGAPYHAPPASRPGEGASARQGTQTHASDIQPHQMTQPNTGNPKLDAKYQQQQQKLIDRQNQQHQQLQQRQEQEHQQAQQRNYNQQQQQQMEQRHQQQTQQMEHQHEQQIQHMQTRQSGPRR